MTFASTSDALDRLAPIHEFASDWDDVLVRARGPSRRPRAKTGQRLALLTALLVAIVVPLSAIAESRDWWFFSAGAPPPATRVFVVKTVQWDRQSWELVAYRTVNDGICLSFSPVGSKGRGAMNCDRIVGVTPDSKEFPPRAITFLTGSLTRGLQRYVVGAASAEAEEVAVHFADGTILRTQTFAAPRALGAIRFYAARVPSSVLPLQLGSAVVDKLVGFDRGGRVVACLNLPLPPAESAPRSPCG